MKYTHTKHTLLVLPLPLSAIQLSMYLPILCLIDQIVHSTPIRDPWGKERRRDVELLVALHSLVAILRPFLALLLHCCCDIHFNSVMFHHSNPSIRVYCSLWSIYVCGCDALPRTCRLNRMTSGIHAHSSSPVSVCCRATI